MAAAVAAAALLICRLPAGEEEPAAPKAQVPALPEAPFRRDQVLKLPLYAREGVAHVWLVNPIYRTREVFELREGVYALVASHNETEKVRAVPFDAIELDLSVLWEGVERTPIPER